MSIGLVMITRLARIVFVGVGLGVMAAGLVVPFLIPAAPPPATYVAPIPELSATPEDLDASATTVSHAATDASRTAGIRGTVRFLWGQWGGCSDTDVGDVQYTVAGRVDSADDAVGALAADLTAAGWSHDYVRGSVESPQLGLSRAGVAIQVNRAETVASALYELTGPCLHTTRDTATALLQVPASAIPRR